MNYVIKLLIAALVVRLVYRGIVFLVTDTGTRYVMKLPKGM